MEPPHRWPSGSDRDQLGAVVHGPAIIARSPGIVMAVRCVYAYRTGLELHTALRATGVQAEGAMRRSGDGGRPSERWSAPTVVITVDGLAGTAYPTRGSGTSWTPTAVGDASFAQDQQFWVDRLPADSRVIVTAAWPEAGLAGGSVTLELTGLDRLDSTVVPLL